MCHNIINVFKWTHVKQSMNVPRCVMCHHLNKETLTIEINPMNF
jgi:hypothetical protein